MLGVKNRRITIEEPVVAVDSLGDPTRTYNALVTVWASIQPVRGEERYMLAFVQANVDTRFRVNWHPTIKSQVTPKCRIKLSREDSPETFRYFDIKSVNDINEAHREFEIYANEVIE